MVKSHHHESSGPSLGVPASRPEEGVLLCGVEGVLFAIDLVIHLEIVVLEDDTAILHRPVRSCNFTADRCGKRHVPGR